MHLSATRSQIVRVPSWSAAMSSPWCECSVTWLTAAPTRYSRVKPAARTSQIFRVPSSDPEKSQLPSEWYPSPVTFDVCPSYEVTGAACCVCTSKVRMCGFPAAARSWRSGLMQRALICESWY
eukprot:Amastigsp_a508707_40.p4 type:complete len:123 gc:universal Amastigsp_a508707_40:522-154(-)